MSSQLTGNNQFNQQYYGGTTSGNTSGNTITISPNSIAQNVLLPYYTQPAMQVGTTAVLGPRYRTFKLPKTTCPQQVFFNGRLLTLGIIGSNVECAFSGEYLIFDHLEATVSYNNRNTLIITYKDCTYNYNLRDYYFKQNVLLEADLLSILEH